MLQNPTKPQFKLNASLQSASLHSKMKVDFQLNPLVVPLKPIDNCPASITSYHMDKT